MASPLPSQSSLSDSNNSTKSARIITQTVIDAKLNADFEESPNAFDYSNSVRLTNSAGENQPDRMTTSYLHQIQKGKLIQPYGCLLALHEKSLRVIAYSENAPEMLTMPGHAVPIVGGHQPVLCIGTDIRSIFTLPGASALQKARGFEDVSLLNPILVHCKTSGKPFYAIIHRVLGSMVIDFEPVKIYDVPMTAARALQSYNFVAKAITRLHSLPSGSIERLCNTMVKEVFELTGYDRVMAYKFHEDDHGEVIAEITKPGLDPYLGLHYPATDIPQAARFLFLKNKVRMICDCRAKNVKVLQYKNLPFDLTLCGSTLRAPHGCHARYMENMNSIASLILAVVVNEGGEENGSRSNSGNSSIQQQKRKHLWGLVVCHNMTSRFVPYPLRYACEFLSQVFASHVNKELELENQILEKNILRTQTILSDMLMRDAPPLGIISQTPNIMDLVKCDGAALLFRGKIWKLGITPTDYQILDISSWLSERLTDSTTTDSLLDAGYPGALALRDSVCGMVAVRLTVNDMLFWFRTHTAAEIRWDGAKHREDEDESRMMMHPTSSFKAFLGIMRNKSLPWKDHEVDAIHSLLPIVKKTFKDSETDLNMDIIHSKINDMRIDSGRLPELEALTGEILRLIETANVPIFAVDVDGVVKGWNLKISELTGCSTDFALGNCLVDLVEDSAVDTVKNMLQQAKQGQEEKNIQFNIRRHNGSMGSQSQPISLVVNTCASRDIEGKVVVVFFVGQDITGQRTVMDKLTKIQAAYRAIVQNPNPLIPPIFSIDEYGRCSEWNPSLENLSGWKRDETIDKTLLGEVFGTIDNACCCRLKNHESFVNLRIVLNNAMSGHDSDKVTFGFCARDGEYIECVLCASGKVGKEGRVTGVFCFLQLASQELQQAMRRQRLTEQKAMNMGKELSYLKRQTRNSLSGIMFSGKILEGLGLGDEQMKAALQISVSCQNQLKKVLDADMDLDTIVDGYLDLEMVEFRLHEVLGASLSQVMMRSNDKGIHIVHNNWEEEDPAVTTKTTTLYGDALRLQQILADFMLIAVKFTNPGGCVGVQIRLRKVRLGESVELGHTEFRISHEGKGIPVDLLNQLFEDGEGGEPTTEEGMSVKINKKLVKLMNGDIQYTRAAGSSTFIISLKLAIAQKPRN